MKKPIDSAWVSERGGQPAADAPPRTLLIVGDSISLGVAENRGNEILETIAPCYVDLLRPLLPSVDIQVDAGVRRTTSDVCLKVDQMLAKHQPDIALLMIGGSDADMDWRRFVLSEGTIARNFVPLERYEKNLRQIGAKLIAAGVVPILTDMPNHHFEIRGPYISKISGKDVMAMITRRGGQEESDKYLALYRAAVARVASDLGVELVAYGELLDSFDPHEVLSRDGAHPGVKGHRLIADAIAPVLQRLISKRPTELRA